MGMSPRLEATLVTLMVETRGWNAKACTDHVRRLAEVGRGASPESFARVVGNYVAARDERGAPRFTSPGLLAEQGEHWAKTEIAARKAPLKCVDHPGEPAGLCRGCSGEAVPPPAGYRDHLPRRTSPARRRAAMEAARIAPLKEAAA